MVDEADVLQVVSDATGIPTAKLSAGSAASLAGLEQVLAQVVVGQQEAVVQVGGGWVVEMGMNGDGCSWCSTMLHNVAAPFACFRILSSFP